MRSLNDRTALSLLLEHGPLTRTRLGELTGLSKPTASQVVTRLERAGLIAPVGAEQAARGPLAATYGARTDGEHAVAVDVTVHTATSTLVDASGAEPPVAEVPLARAAADRDAVGDIRAAIAAACAAAGTDPSTVTEVVVGLQGAVDPRTDDLTFTGLLPGWPRRSPRARLEDGLGVRVRIDNDANLAAVAERAAGAAHAADGFALLWLGEGLGVAVDLGGTLHRGASGGAGEIGYLPVPRAAVELDAAAIDLQDLLGGTGVTRVARAHGIRGRTLEAVLAALPGHPSRHAVLRDLAVRIALGVVPVLAVLDPPLVVLGGPTGAAGGEELADQVRMQVRRVSRWSPQVAATAVPDHPVIRGGRELAVADLRARLLARIT
ncbi:MAG TPA: ROK family transcriptional regulator [Cellulomonas sp.]